MFTEAKDVSCSYARETDCLGTEVRRLEKWVVISVPVRQLGPTVVKCKKGKAVIARGRSEK